MNNKKTRIETSIAIKHVIEADEDAKDVRVARRALERMKAKGEKPIPWSQVKKELGL